MLFDASGILAVGVKESSTFNNIFTGVNLLVVTYVVVCGLFKADIHNWKLTSDDVKVCHYKMVVTVNKMM